MKTKQKSSPVFRTVFLIKKNNRLIEFECLAGNRSGTLNFRGPSKNCRAWLLPHFPSTVLLYIYQALDRQSIYNVPNLLGLGLGSDRVGELG